jgi:dinuclear metal center YbgI/SA1388 family protein
MKIENIIERLESIAAPSYQEDYDNSGLLTGEPDGKCTGVLVSLDCTEEVVQEAIVKKCNLIVSHHPLIFRPVRRILADNGVGKALIRAIKAGISIYAIHTNLDNILPGVNAAIADKLGLVNRKFILPKTENPGIGSGLVGDLAEPLTEKQVLIRLKEQFGIPVIRHSPLTGGRVTRVAVCGGAGSFLIPNALDEKVGFFISADIKYHEFFAADGKMVIADIGHFESEQFTIDLIHDIILEKFPNFAVLKSGTKTNPVNYYI